MRLYTRTGVTVLNDPEFGIFAPEEDGSFMLPEELAERLRSFHVGGRPAWESEVERQHRLAREDLERRQDPATLYDAVQQLVDQAKAASPAPAPEPVAKATRARKATATAPSAG